MNNKNEIVAKLVTVLTNIALETYSDFSSNFVASKVVVAAVGVADERMSTFAQSESNG